MQLEKCRQINRETGSCGLYSRRRIGTLSIDSDVTWREKWRLWA